MYLEVADTALLSKVNAKFLALIALLILLVACDLTSDRSSDFVTTSADLVFTSEDFSLGELTDVTSTAAGLTLAPGAVTGQYLSPVIDAPIDFNAVVPQWQADVPEAASVTIRLRTGTANGWWSDWLELADNDDWMRQEDTDIVGQMITVPAVDVTHQKIQFAISFSRGEGETSAILEQLRLTFIDSSRGPTAIEMVAQQEALESHLPEEAGSGYPKPSVVSREVWCTDPACNYSDGLEYEPVSHLIVHHTVSGNTSSDWAAVVRAIWYFHTFTRGWADVGYNYLVDMNGVLYEGHLGGDDVVGIHAGGANAGSMALAFLGTFTEPNQNPPGISPPPEMLNSAADLFAWKADQKEIDVFDASYLPNVDWGLPNLMSHRDVYGSTVCPGDQAHELLPWLREEVASRIGFVSPYIYVDELSDAFTKSDTNWKTPIGGCGFNGHAYYTWSTTNPASSANWAEWRPILPRGGAYDVEVYAPYCITGQSETDGAVYTITSTDGTDTVTVSHQANVGTWTSLGTFNFAGGNSSVIRLTDLTTNDSGLGVWFDAIRLRPLEPLPDLVVTNQLPPQYTWIQHRTITFEWSVSDPASVSATRLEVAADEEFTNIILSEPLPGTAVDYTYTFAQDYAVLYWRVAVTTTDNRSAISQATRFGIDTAVPVSAVQAIYRLEDGRYIPVWAGNDETSGVASYNVDYWGEGDVTITRWLSDSTDTSA
ncbi:MAG: N-acetylmuramoyl-L-alanine amidase, partial [Candidatus Promineifilaceae bacterium]